MADGRPVAVHDRPLVRDKRGPSLQEAKHRLGLPAFGPTGEKNALAFVGDGRGMQRQAVLRQERYLERWADVIDHELPHPAPAGPADEAAGADGGEWHANGRPAPAQNELGIAKFTFLTVARIPETVMASASGGGLET